MHPISLIFLGLCAFLIAFWLVRQLERRKVKSSGPQAMSPPTPSVSVNPPQVHEAKRASVPSRSPAPLADIHRPVPPVDPVSVNANQGPNPAGNYDIRDLILANRHAEAIALLHEQKGWDLAHAQEYVAQQAKRQSSKDLDPEVIDEARKLIAENRKIVAIKLIYDHTGWSLKAAKDYVENSL